MLKKYIIAHVFNGNISRCMSTNVKELFKTNYKTNSWQIHSYGDIINEIQLTSTRIPVIQNPKGVLVKVEAASLNPIDSYMAGGYGRTLFQLSREQNDELPLTPGRDFCGTVLLKGHSVDDSIKIGDKVYGFVPLNRPGSFSEIILSEEDHMVHKPSHLSSAESTSLIYGTMTAWSALYITGGLLFKNTKGLRILILGASGGVGTAAVQLLKSQGCEVIGTCSSDAVPLVSSLGADKVFDYREKDYWNRIANEGRYQIILDCGKVGYQNIPNQVNFNTYVALNSPLMVNTDKYGLVGGFAVSANDLLRANVYSPGKFVKWGYFIPSNSGLKFIDRLIKEDRIRPVIHKEFNFQELPEAFKELQKGHLRGKIVINV